MEKFYLLPCTSLSLCLGGQQRLPLQEHYLPASKGVKSGRVHLVCILTIIPSFPRTTKALKINTKAQQNKTVNVSTEMLREVGLSLSRTFITQAERAAGSAAPAAHGCCLLPQLHVGGLGTQLSLHPGLSLLPALPAAPAPSTSPSFSNK